ncbi:hypothetical protein HOC37_01100 [bacterium]|jgi:hypothetical protein|nr:hypothetical protein [bacterium]MBT4551562.1 hypothetical protein [bacterium]MBT5988171.1 hypothetical protein [bacterium]
MCLWIFDRDIKNRLKQIDELYTKKASKKKLSKEHIQILKKLIKYKSSVNINMAGGFGTEYWNKYEGVILDYEKHNFSRITAVAALVISIISVIISCAALTKS